MADLFQVEFKGSRRDYYQNTYHHPLLPHDLVIVQAEHGEEHGRLTKKLDRDSEASHTLRPRSVLRKATPDDLRRIAELGENELAYKREVVLQVRRHGLVMKIVDAEIQFDESKVTFYFTADHRVDFRALVRDLAGRFRTRIELRQIGVRDEARRIDGYGVCGRRQCCNGHIKEFAPITTAHAREQDLSLNPSKISGNCGRLLCCLKYEVEMYAGVKKLFPPPGSIVRFEAGSGLLDRIDYFSEEAIVRTAEDTPPIRLKADQITGYDAPRQQHRRGGHSRDQEHDEDSIRRLEDPTNGN